MTSYEMVPVARTMSSEVLGNNKNSDHNRDHNGEILVNSNQGRTTFPTHLTSGFTHGTNSAMNHVLLLRAPSSGGQDDPYESQFRVLGADWTATSIQVLDTKFTGVEELQWIIHTGPKFHGYKGVILTSARSAYAWKQAVEILVESADDTELKANWTNVPFYVVGESTASALQDHSPSHLASLYPSACLGANSGTGEQLANFILSNGSTTKRCKTKLLFLVGDKNRDILPKALEAGGYELDTLQVYETCGSPLFASSLGSVVSSSPSTKEWWVAFFAPSSSEFAITHLRNHFNFTSVDGSLASSPLPPARVVAIGSTTATCLTDKLQVKVDVTAEKPKAQSLVESISNYSG